MSGSEPPSGDPTRRIDPVEGQASPAGGEGDAAGGDRPGRGKLVAVGLGGLLLGFVIAFLVVALGSSDPDGEADAVATERIEELEGELAARDARIEELEGELAARDTRIEELQAQVADAEAAAGEQDADLAAQREALEERARALDEREAALDERSAALDERREAIESGGSDPGDGDPGVELDEEDARNLVDRVVDQIRDLFR